jgi:hypothetical protein
MSDRRSDPAGFNRSVIGEFRANGGVVGGELENMALLLLTTTDTPSGRPRRLPTTDAALVTLSSDRTAVRRDIPDGSATWSETRT